MARRKGDRMSYVKGIEQIGSPTSILAEMRRFREDVILLAAMRPKLCQEHPNKWVAFHGGLVVAISGDLDSLLSEVDQRGLKRDSVVTQYLTTAKRVMIL